MLSQHWQKSSYSQGGSTNCVEARTLGLEEMEVRDSQNPNQGHLSFSAIEWSAFLEEVKSERI